MSLHPNPTWYKDAVIYEVHVRSFFDGNDDGIGDFAGLTQKLDYLQDLGVTAIWLLPFYPSPLKDDGYDIADYRKINPDYGTMEDFVEFLDEAHRRGLRVITELVINHTSDQHPWFKAARQAPPGSPEREFYVWSDTVEKYQDTRIIFQDFEASNWAWDPVAEAYYWHRFYSHQPDLNFDNPAVHEAVVEVLDYWLEMGVDGLRLDAVPYLYEREGTNCENLPETHEYLKKLRAHVDSKFDDRMLLAEANQWPEDAAAYFGDGDECHMNFHFPLMPRLYLAAERGDRFPIVDVLEQTPEIPDNCQWATFLRNHDELTLEMVTDEERDYMYRTYAKHQRARINLGIRRRLAPLMQNDRRKIELMHGLLFALPGTPVLYYGDEIGMGDNFFLGDRNGVRTPMQWSGDRNAGFSRANPQQLYLPVIFDPEYHYEAVNVQIQQANSNSLLWSVKRMIALRNRHQVFGSGKIRFLNPENRKILAFLRYNDDETVLVVANLSRHPQSFELDLSEYHSSSVVELSGFTEFPPVEDAPYRLVLGAHSVMYFGIGSHTQARTVATADGTLPQFHVKGDAPWTELLNGDGRLDLEQAIRDSLPTQRWFRGRLEHVRSISIAETLHVESDECSATIVSVEVDYRDRTSDTYTLPLALVSGEEIEHLMNTRAIAYARVYNETGSQWLLIDALWLPAFTRSVLDLALNGGRMGDASLHLRGVPVGSPEDISEGRPRVLGAEPSSTAVSFYDEWVLKFYRRLEPGQNPEVEMVRFLTDIGFDHAPVFGGAVELREGRIPRSTVAVVQKFVPNEGSAWSHALDELELFFDETLSTEASDGENAELSEFVSPYVDTARQLAERTAQLHRALASARDPQFAPEKFSQHYQRSIYQELRNLVGRVYEELRRFRDDRSNPDESRAMASDLLDSRSKLYERFNRIRGERIRAGRIRIHGDLHLGQFLSTGRDFLITEFEGEPARPFGERRIKRNPLRDVAGMLRSFHYATHTAMDSLRERGMLSETAPRPEVMRWGRRWAHGVGRIYFAAYLEEADDLRGSILPTNTADIDRLLDIFVLAKAVYEIGYELGNRPSHRAVPMRDLLELLQGEPLLIAP